LNHFVGIGIGIGISIGIGNAYLSNTVHMNVTKFSFNPAGHAGHHFESELPWVSPQLEPYEQLLYKLLLLSQPCSHIGLCHPP